MELAEAYRRLRNNRFVKGKKIMLVFRTIDKDSNKKNVKISATKFGFFVEEKLARKLLREVCNR